LHVPTISKQSLTVVHELSSGGTARHILVSNPSRYGLPNLTGESDCILKVPQALAKAQGTNSEHRLFWSIEILLVPIPLLSQCLDTNLAASYYS